MKTDGSASETTAMAKRLDDMGVTAAKPSFKNGLKSAKDAQIWGLQQTTTAPMLNPYAASRDALPDALTVRF